MERYDTNFILNSCFDNTDSTLILDRYDTNYIFSAIFDSDKSALRVKIDGFPDILIPNQYLIVNDDGTGFTLSDGPQQTDPIECDHTYIDNIIRDFKRIIAELTEKINSLQKPNIKPSNEYVYDTYIPSFRVVKKAKKENVVYGNNLILPINQVITNKPCYIKSIEIPGHFTIPGLGGNYRIKDNRVINRDDIDLINFLPVYFNIDTGDLILCAYTNYKVSSGEFLLEYMTKRKSTGGTGLFYAGNKLWYKWIFCK